MSKFKFSLLFLSLFVFAGCGESYKEGSPAPADTVVVELPDEASPSPAPAPAPATESAVTCNVTVGTIGTPGFKGFRTVQCDINRPYLGYTRYGDKMERVTASTEGGFAPNLPTVVNNYGHFQFDGKFTSPASMVIEVGQATMVTNGPAVSHAAWEVQMGKAGAKAIAPETTILPAHEPVTVLVN